MTGESTVFFDGEALKQIIANPNYPCSTFLLLTSSNVHSFRIFKKLRAWCASEFQTISDTLAVVLLRTIDRATGFMSKQKNTAYPNFPKISSLCPHSGIYNVYNTINHICHHKPYIIHGIYTYSYPHSFPIPNKPQIHTSTDLPER